jgi:DNA-binding IclR family transcriptional regulator
MGKKVLTKGIAQQESVFAVEPTSGVNNYMVPALQRGLQMLCMFGRDQRELSGADFAHQLGLPRASIFRILQTLEAAGFIERIAQSTRYRLGVAALRLGFETIASLDLSDHAKPVIDGLRDATGYSAHLVVRDERQVVVIAKAVGFAKLFNSIQVGARLPAHATVLGRVLLGGLSERALEQLFQGVQLERYTSLTPATLADLKRVVAVCKEQGYGISQGGFETGISTVVAPVVDRQGQLCAAVSITVPMAQIPADQSPRLVAMVVDAARQLSLLLGATPLTLKHPKLPETA